jgi:aryl carrier-like protein
MSNPNDELCKWIFKVIDTKFSPLMYNKPPTRKPFTYEDLETAGYDSVRVTKLNEPERKGYEIQFEVIGAYEDFLEEVGMVK